jgi:hypothetical protein
MVAIEAKIKHFTYQMFVSMETMDITFVFKISLLSVENLAFSYIISNMKIFVMDAFGTAHRAQASTHSVIKQAKIACAGPLLSAELDEFRQTFCNGL